MRLSRFTLWLTQLDLRQNQFDLWLTQLDLRLTQLDLRLTQFDLRLTQFDLWLIKLVLRRIKFVFWPKNDVFKARQGGKNAVKFFILRQLGEKSPKKAENETNRSGKAGVL